MKKSILFAFIILAPCIYSQLRINELMTNNVSAVWDGSHNFSMWVELYNPGNTPVNQSLFFFTDDLTQPRKWQPPGVVIPAKGYQLLFFERLDRAGHSNFRLNPQGGRLFLMNASGGIVDFVVYPAQFRNISYGRHTDGSDDWVFFEDFSPRASNNGRRWAAERCAPPRFTLPGGMYNGPITVRFENPAPGDTIFFVRSSEEPTRANGTRYVPGSAINITANTVIRARTFSARKLSSDVVTATYLIGLRDFRLPVVSIVTPQAFLFDNTIGIYVRGTNGIPGNGTETPANWNQDWDRPANFELIDTTNTVRLNQELDIQIAGGWSRTMNPQKSLHIKPKLKFNNNRLNYDIFAASKPGNQYRDIMLRNSGNDFSYSMLRDGFMQSLVMHRMNIDGVAYEPAVCFINGVYYGIQNLRERTNPDYLFSNYGLDEEEVILLDHLQFPTHPGYLQLLQFITNNDITNPAIFQQVTEMMDVENYIDYMMTQIFVGNYDWPHNNVKMWKPVVGGRWRWILFDLDFGFNLYDTNLHNFNSLTYALGEASSRTTQEWATALFRRLVVSPIFRNRLIDRFSIHLSSTFETNRINHVLDSLAAKISTEISFHKNRWGSARAFDVDINNMKTFSAHRANNVFSHLSSRFLNGAALHNIHISSNLPNATYRLNGELIPDATIRLRGFNGRQYSLQANPIKGYRFKHWELQSAPVNTTLIAYDSMWRYWDLNGMPAANWFTAQYNDAAWRNGQAVLGYGNAMVRTTIDFGPNANSKHPTAYFRRTIYIEQPEALSNIVLTVFADDGAACYVNGVEVGRFNLPAGPLTFNTLTTTWNNGEHVSFNVPASLLRQGENLIAVEVHQTTANSSDLMFNLQLTADNRNSNPTLTNDLYGFTLTGNMQLRAVYEENDEPNPIHRATIAINEIVASNNTIPDPLGETDDYVELYNYGNEPVNIAGWYLSDDSALPRKAQIPATHLQQTLIPPQGYLVLWCDSSPQQGVRHVGFNLNSLGETVVLSVDDKFGVLHQIDRVTFPTLSQNMSFSRNPDGVGSWVVQSPTMGGSNALTNVPSATLNDISVYPTLVQNELWVEGAEGKTIRITDVSGKVVLEQTALSHTQHLSLSFLHRGVYLLTIEHRTFKIMKK